MDTPLSKEEIASVIDYHFPTVINVERGVEDNRQARARKEFERKLQVSWDGEREVAIKKCVEDINRRITERIREY